MSESRIEIEVAISDLPPVPRLIAEAIGLTKTLQLIRDFGGSTVHVPAGGLSQDHILRTILSDLDCRLLNRYFVGTISIPKSSHAFAVARNRCIWRDSIQNSARYLVAKYRLTSRQIANAIASHEARLEGMQID